MLVLDCSFLPLHCCSCKLYSHSQFHFSLFNFQGTSSNGVAAQTAFSVFTYDRNPLRGTSCLPVLCQLFAVCSGNILKPTFEMVGSSGLEPPTSRLSGVRSNHLSYEPMSARTPVSCLRPARFPGSFRGSLDSQVSTVSSFSPSFTSCRGAAAFRQPFQTTR